MSSRLRRSQIQLKKGALPPTALRAYPQDICTEMMKLGGRLQGQPPLKHPAATESKGH